jgi:hypothetical protein
MNTSALRFDKHRNPNAVTEPMSDPSEVLRNIRELQRQAHRIGNTENRRYYARMMTVLIANWHRQNKAVTA